MSSLTFRKFIDVSLSRSRRWHKGGVEDWSVSDWAVSIAGEAGEMCNAVKKLRRIEDQNPNENEEGRRLETREQAVDAIGDEMADVICYLPQLAAVLGIDLEAKIVEKFNKVSERYGFPERL